MSVKDRIIEFIRYKKTNKNKFEKSIGRTTGFVNNIGDGLNMESLDKIRTAYPELNPTWLLTGEGQMLNTIPQDNKPIEEIIRDLHERIINLEGQTEIYKTTIAGMLSTSPIDYSKKLADLETAISEAVSRRLDELSKK